MLRKIKICRFLISQNEGVSGIEAVTADSHSMVDPTCYTERCQVSRSLTKEHEFVSLHRNQIGSMPDIHPSKTMRKVTLSVQAIGKSDGNLITSHTILIQNLVSF